MSSTHRPTWAPAMGKDETRSELELKLAESRARALKHKQAGLLPLPEDEDEGDQSDKTPLLKQITGDEKGIQHRTEDVKSLEKINSTGSWRQKSSAKFLEIGYGGYGTKLERRVAMATTKRKGEMDSLASLSKTINGAGEYLRLPMRGMEEWSSKDTTHEDEVMEEAQHLLCISR
ncbi:hypothetical protein PPACK8108_LOCUS10988 [Phakopsora pachyrhizi]|uniref:Uncharacterized protein n=1 Tax=Phakopsora pachyrhizi TaxID=170000 RepID=A0AAV0AZR4_PHAPC|nr:hypothetical protein PPACK8108_LOCUS10988 [Phakopsora pachyrhizi]